MKSIPNLFVIGAPKSGTTAFVNALKNHPDIFVPEEKEPRFFDAHVFYDYDVDYPLKSLEEYLSIYDAAEAQDKKYRVDGSVFNMYSEEAIKQILSLSPDAKFIVILRDPLSAIKSMFSQRMKYLSIQMREVSDCFDECWATIENNQRARGLGYPKGCRNKFIFRYDLLYSYEKYLPVLLKQIKKENLYIASYSDFKSRPSNFYQLAFKYLGIINFEQVDNQLINESFQLKINLRLKIVGLLSSKTLWLRRKLGLSGNWLSRAKKIIVGGSKSSTKISTNSDEKIKYYFRGTYEYLAKLDINT